MKRGKSMSGKKKNLGKPWDQNEALVEHVEAPQVSLHGLVLLQWELWPEGEQVREKVTV